MESQSRQRRSTLTLRLRRGLYEVRPSGEGERFVLGDNPEREAPTSIFVKSDEGALPSTVVIERGAHSYFPVYFAVTDIGEAVIADTMGFMHDMARRPQMELNREAQLDHLLFGRSPATGLVSGVDVVDHGERLVLERSDAGWQVGKREKSDRFKQSCDSHWRQKLPQLSSCLEGAVETISPSSVLFSGGVDSTLLRSMLADDVEMTSGRVPDEAFLPEVEQAARAAALFDGEHRYVDVDHDEYLFYLVDLTRRTGLPCPAMQHVLQTRVAGRAKTPVVYGELGDGMFGLPVVEDSRRRRWVEEEEASMSLAASRVFSVASMRAEDHCFEDSLEAVYGPVDEAYQRRARRVCDLVEWPASLRRPEKNWARFVGFGHLIDYLTVGCVKCVRDFASSEGVVVHTPLTDRRLIDTFYGCDAATRYRDEGRTKPVMKTLLEQRVSAYAVDRPKLASGLPRTWYFTEGPLVDVFERYPPPTPMARAVERAIEEPRWGNSWILWPTLSYAVWYHEWFDAETIGERSDLVVHRWRGASSASVKAAS